MPLPTRIAGGLLLRRPTECVHRRAARRGRSAGSVLHGWIDHRRAVAGCSGTDNDGGPNAGERQAQADSNAHDLFATYEEQTPRSRALHERATAVMPGGDTRSVTYHRPYPSFITEAKDAWFETADGER